VTGALRAAKLDGECDKVYTGLTRHHAKSPVTTSAELYHIYRTWDPHAASSKRQFSPIVSSLFSSVDGAVRVPRNLMGSAIKRTQASPDIMLSPPLQRAQSSTTFIAPGTPTPLQ
jgi:hypothetical protein